MDLSDRSDHLTDALIYFGRGEWFDIYKAIECLQAFAGGEPQLKAKQWAKPGDITLMKWTATIDAAREPRLSFAALSLPPIAAATCVGLSQMSRGQPC